MKKSNQIFCCVLLIGLAQCDAIMYPIGPSLDGGLPEGREYGPCDVPIPDHITLQTPVWGESPVHFYVPHARWALATAFAARQFEHLGAQQIDLRLSPSFLFALALKESFLGCDATTGADPIHPQYVYKRQLASDQDGCFQIEETTGWAEVCRLYPNHFDCQTLRFADVLSASEQTITGRSNFSPAALVVSYYMTFAYAMLTHHGCEDPDVWFREAKDPLAKEKIMALIYNRGAWFADLAALISTCQNQLIEDCLTPGSVERDYVQAVSAYTEELQTAVANEQCYAFAISMIEINDFFDRLAVLLPNEDWPILKEHARQAFLTASAGKTPAPFQQVAPPVLDVLHTQLQTRLVCPHDQLQSYYGVGCPP